MIWPEREPTYQNPYSHQKTDQNEEDVEMVNPEKDGNPQIEYPTTAYPRKNAPEPPEEMDSDEVSKHSQTSSH